MVSTIPASYSPTLRAAGLFAGSVPIALERVDVRADVVDATAEVTIIQRFRNTEATPLEVVYVFPLDEGAAVRRFEAVVDAVHFVGSVKARDEAFVDYDEAIERGHGAYLLDEERADVFTASLGNVKPGSEVRLTIAYVTELASEGAALRFTLPTTVSPRYAPAQDRAGVGRTDAEALNPPVAGDVPYGFTFTMDARMASRIARIESPSHPLSVEHKGHEARVTLSQREPPMDRDLVVVIEAEAQDVPRAIVERGTEGAAIAVTWLPGFEAPRGPAEVLFLVDRSGSMHGTSILEVRNALHLCLRSLTSGSAFNIVGFGSHYDLLFPESRPYDDESLAVATAHLSQLEADLGGTELQPALEHVLALPPVEGLSRQVVVFTDGEVTNTDAVIGLAAKHAPTARVFTFGIGAGASQHLVRGLARAGRGKAEFIAPGERIEAKVMRQFQRVFMPAFTDVTVDWHGQEVVQAPAAMPAVFAGERVRLYGLGAGLESGTVTLTGTIDGRRVSFDIAFDPASAHEGTAIGALAARARIRDLEEEPAYLEARGSRQQRARPNQKAVDEIVRLGIAYQLVSRETSFVAIEHRETPITEQAQLRRVPVALTSGWGGIQGGAWPRRVSAWGPVGTPDVLSMGRQRAWSAHSSDSEPMARSATAFASAPVSRERLVREEAASAASAASAAQRPLDALVRLQRADGSWELNRELASVIGRGLRQLLKEAHEQGSDADEHARRRFATRLALEWLDAHAADQRDEWWMLAEKARAWLEHARG